MLVSFAGLAYRMGWFAKLPIPALARLVPSSSAPGRWRNRAGRARPRRQARPRRHPANRPPSTPAPAGTAAPAGAPAVVRSPSRRRPPPTDAVGSPLIPAPVFDGNVASLDFGGTVETWTTDTNESADHQEIIDGRKESWVEWARGKPHPGEFVLSFFAREPMLIDRVVLRPGPAVNNSVLGLFPKDIEIWTSMAATADGPFEKVATASLPPVKDQKGEATVSFSPVEARFLKFRALTNQAGAAEFVASEIKVMEAQRPGYVPLMTRHPELQWPGGPNNHAAGPTTKDGPVCAPAPESAAAPAPPAHPESRRVILINEGRGTHLAGAMFERSRFAPGEEDCGAAPRRIRA